MNNNAPYSHNRVVKINNANPEMPNLWNKEKAETFVFVAPVRSQTRKFAKAVEVRIYWSRNGQTAYAVVFAHNRDHTMHLNGHGKAGGYGYHKESAAACEAFSSAGIELERHFGGCGESPIIKAVEALARKLGWKTGEVMTF